MLDIQDNDLLDDQQVEAHRQAYNAAFDELGLNWHWDPVTYACLPAAGRDGLRVYLMTEQSHLLRAYDLDFLVEAIETAKARCLDCMLSNRVRAAGYASGPAQARARPPA